MSIHQLVLHNSQIREAGEAMLAPGQLGLLSGWGVFSTLRIHHGVLFAWERHWTRLKRDAELMHVAMPVDSEQVRSDLLSLVAANRAHEATLRLVIVRNGGGMWEGPSSGRASDVIALTADTSHWGASVRLAYQAEARHSKSDFARAKILSWAQNLTYYERAHEAGFDECVLLNERGEVTECTSANIFVVKDRHVWTAPLAAGCLPGVTREILLAEIQAPGVKIGEQTLLPEDLESADEVFITSTTRDLLPVAQIGMRELRSAGGVRVQLLERFRNYLEAYTAAG